MINYSYPLYRPPAEASNIIIQATYGCSYNNCSFCSMYKSKKYKIREIEDIFEEIDILSVSFTDARKVFMGDGDALALPTDYLVKLLKYLKRSFPKLRRVSLYATAQNLLTKTQDELSLLNKNGLNLIYFGIETGNDKVLKKITKGVTSSQIIESLNKASKSNIKISATVILGIGGKEYSKEHIKDTADIVNKTTINYLSTLQLGLESDIKERFYRNFEDFIMLNDEEVLKEQLEFIKLLNPINKVIFRSNHASNALHLSGNIPKDKDRLIDELNFTLDIGESAFTPKSYRGF
ncbi:MAG: radical SAM protein [Campylobacterota bacterium]|nr:radical SAM protein [Campylobacterota bacterium]